MYCFGASYAAVEMELSPDFSEVNESTGFVEYCLRVTMPMPQQDLPLEIFVDLETIPGTAGRSGTSITC